MSEAFERWGAIGSSSVNDLGAALHFLLVLRMLSNEILEAEEAALFDVLVDLDLEQLTRL